MGRNNRSAAMILAVGLASLSGPAALRASAADSSGGAGPGPEVTHVFLLIGQSNMAGRGQVEPVDLVPHPRVFSLSKDERWITAVEPIAFDKPGLAGVGPGCAFGRAVADAHPGWVVGLVPAAFGGTTLEEWSPAGRLYRDAVSRARAALGGGARLAAVLWLQGESETPQTAQTYVSRFSLMAASLRTDLGAKDVPIIVGELGRFVTVAPSMNPQLARLPAAVPRCTLVPSLGLTDKGDHLHFNSASARELGLRYARAFGEAWAPVAAR
jgi:Carbohydrate esterase, sialic acid-specific acetylesterase